MATVIRNAIQLQNMSVDLTADYELGSDIDASGTAAWNGGLGFDPIGTYTAGVPANAFSGSFDGKGYKIKNLTINRPLEDYVGLFGYTLGAGKEIKNVGLENISIVGGDYSVAGLVGFDDRLGTIENCRITGSLTSTGRVALFGGLAGYTHGIISDCSFSGNITINNLTALTAQQNGGLIGLLGGGTIGVRRCFTTGTFTCNGWGAGGSGFEDIGGLVGLDSSGLPLSFSECYSTMDIVINLTGGGENIWGIGGFIGDSDGGNISDCYARGNVTANGVPADTEVVGGFAGYNDQTLENCYSTGLVTSNGIAHIGGFCGWNDGGTITNCFWDTETSGQATSDGGTGKTTEEMKDISTFQNAGWSMSIIWNVLSYCNNGYPCLVNVNAGCTEISSNADATISECRVTLEAIRNLEFNYGGRFYIDKEGNATYESRYHRNV